MFIYILLNCINNFNSIFDQNYKNFKLIKFYNHLKLIINLLIKNQ